MTNRRRFKRRMRDHVDQEWMMCRGSCWLCHKEWAEYMCSRHVLMRSWDDRITVEFVTA